MASLITACGGGDDYEPNYNENAMPPERRVDGELAFTSPSLMKMAESFRISGDYTNAIRLYQRAANESPRHVTSRLALGQIYQRLGATDGAITYYRQVLELEPGNAEAELGLGQMLVARNQSMEAIQYLEAAAEKSPNNFRIYNSIGLAYDLEGHHVEAQNAYGKGLARNPDHISLLNNLALSLAFENEYAPAIQLLSKAINLDYSQTTAQQNLVMIYAMSGEEDAARAMARTLMTPEEIDANMERYKWLATLSSKRRAQAIFLNLSSFPNEEIVEEVSPVSDATPADTAKDMDPKRQMLEDILNSESQISTKQTQPVEIVPMMEEPVEEPAKRIGPTEVAPLLEANQRFRLQLGSYISQEDVNKDWNRLQGMAPELLANDVTETVEIRNADNQPRYRLMIGSFDNYNAAVEKCRALESRQVPCLVLQSANN